MKYSIIGLLSLLMPLFGVAQSDCFEVKYLDFFEWDLKISEEIDTKRVTEQTMFQIKEDNPMTIPQVAMIPMIVKELKYYHPVCTEKLDTASYQTLLDLYFGVSKMDMKILTNKTVSEQLDFIRDNFYTQVLDASFLPKMMLTYNYGPYYGEDVVEKIDMRAGKTTLTNFGKLVVIEGKNKSYLLGIDKQEQLLWVKATSVFDVQTKGISLGQIKENSLCYRVEVSSQNTPSFTLYLRPNGHFLFYCY
jgi:hypothetical protein